MTNLLDTKQNLTKEIDSNELYQSLNKKNVLQQLTKIRIDHSITISESDLKIKMQMVYEACQHLTNKQFIDNCINLAKTELFGKFPPAYKFAQSPTDEFAHFRKYKEHRDKNLNGGSNAV